MQSPRGTEVFVADPDDAAMVLRADPKYPRRFTMPVYDNFIQEHKKKAGVFFLEGHEWHKHRSVLSKRMLKPPEINKYVPRLNSIVTDVIGRFERLRSPRDSLTAFEINEIDMELFRWSFESVTDMLFDKRLGTLSDTPPKEAVDFITSVGVFLETVVSASLFPEGVHKFYKPKVYREFEQNFLNMYYYSDKLIKEKMEELGRRQDLGKVNSGEDEIQEFIPFLLSSGKITREDLQSSIVDTLFAGVDTTSNTLGWSLYLLSKNPSKQQKLRDEIDGVLGCKEVADISSLDKMPYLKAVIKETLRIYPVLITINRILAESIVLSGYHVPAGTHINMMTRGMGQLESLFPNAQEFMPERWLRRNSKIEMNAFSSLPFGFGRRLALLEMYLLLTRIIQRFELDYPKGEFVERRLRGTTIPDRPLRVKFLDRK